MTAESGLPAPVRVVLIYDQSSGQVQMEATTGSHVLIIGMLELARLAIEELRRKQSETREGRVIIPMRLPAGTA